MGEIGITSEKLSQYIDGSRDCKITKAGCAMDSLRSTFSIDLSSFGNICGCTIIGKRLSGDGGLIVNEKSIKILSKISHTQDVEFKSTIKKLVFSRPIKSSGKVLISGIKLKITAEEVVEHHVDEIIKLEPEIATPDWREVLSQCKPHKNIRVVKDRLFASEGGAIKSKNIESIVTSPTNAYNIKDGFIKFIIPCEVLELRRFNKSPVISKPLFKDMVAPSTIRSGDNYEIPTIKDNLRIGSYPIINLSSKVARNSVIYDSKECGLDIKTLGKVSGSISNVNEKKGLLLGRDASFVIPASQMECYVEYIIAISARKTVGNGKLEVSIVTDNGTKRDSLLLCVANMNREIYYKIKSGAPPGTKKYQVKIERPKASVGDLVINRIKIIHGLTSRPPYIPAHMQRTNTLKGLVGFYDVSDSDIVAQTAKKYSRHLTYDTKEKYELSGEIYITTMSGINWFNKIKPMYPNLNLDIAINSNKKDIVMGELGALLPANKIWVDAFSDYSKVSESDDKAFSQAKIIMTPSFSNSQFLMDKYKNTEVIQVERSWPIINSTPLNYFNQDYFLYFNRSSKITERLVNTYKKIKGLPKLVIVGARGNYPDFVIPVNEYIAYDKFLYILLNSKMVIDFSPNTDYNSAALSIALDEGIPIVSSNWFCLDKENTKFVVSKDNIDGISVPTVDAIKDSLESIGSLKKVGIKSERNNSKVHHFLSLLASE